MTAPQISWHIRPHPSFRRRPEPSEFNQWKYGDITTNWYNLNVLIGPNASGKTNLFEVIRLLQASPSDLSEPVRTGGGISDWIWRGQPKSSAKVEAIVHNPGGHQPLRHVIEFRESGRRFTLEDERIENESPYDGQFDTYFYYRYGRGHPVLNTVGDNRRYLQRDDVEPVPTHHHYTLRHTG